MEDVVVVEKILHAPVDRVWSAITNKNEMKAWYFDLEDFKPEQGFTFKFNGGPEEGPVYVHLCEVTEVIPEQKLTYSWRYEGLPGISYVTWALEAKGENTLLTLTHTGLGSIAVSGAAFAIENFKGGWDHFINKALPSYVGKNLHAR